MPVYRDVLKHAFINAWHERRYWPLAFFASILLTASSYDILLKSFDGIALQSARIAEGTGLPTAAQALRAFADNASSVMNAAFALQVVMVLAIVIMSVAALSCITQGGLVYALGAVKRGRKPTLREALGVGGGAFWPVAALNAVSLSAIWVLRFFVALPLYLALQQPNQINWTLYLVSFIVFVPLAFMVSIVQIFALNAMILQGAPAADAVLRGYLLFKKHWVVVVETAAILFAITVGLGIVFSGLVFVLLVPLVATILTAAVLGSQALYVTALGVALGLLLLGLFAASAFATQLYYASWTYLYRKLGEGGVIPKIHRWLRTLTGSFSVR